MMERFEWSRLTIPRKKDLPLVNKLLLIKDCALTKVLGVSHLAPGYHVNSNAVTTESGLEIPLVARPGQTDFFGKTIKDLVVQVDYEAVDRLRVKASSFSSKVKSPWRG